jgi:hypothetical protein
VIIIGTSDTLWSTWLTHWFTFKMIGTSWTITGWGINSVTGTRFTIGFDSDTLFTFVGTFFTDVDGIEPVIWTVTGWWTDSVLSTGPTVFSGFTGFAHVITRWTFGLVAVPISMWTDTFWISDSVFGTS